MAPPSKQFFFGEARPVAVYDVIFADGFFVARMTPLTVPGLAQAPTQY